MQEVELFTQHGRLVATVKIPPSKMRPLGVIWGERTFFWNEERQQYREGLMAWAQIYNPIRK